MGQERADAVRTMAHRFARLASQASDPRLEVKPTPGWSILDVLGHVAMEPSRYEQLALGKGSWPARAADLPAFNAEQIRTLPTRKPVELARKLIADTENLLSTIASFGTHAPMMNFDGNQRVRADRALGTLLAEFIVHGHDVAQTIGAPWPIEPSHVPIVLQGTHQVMPGWINPDTAPDHTVTFQLRLRKLDLRHTYAIERGQLHIDPDERNAVDLHISAEPVTWLLLSYGRISQWRAALTGRVLTWGRKPWLATKFATFFYPP